MRTSIILALVMFPALSLQSQTNRKATIEGLVLNDETSEPVPFASVAVLGTATGAVTNEAGYFLISGVEPGFIKLGATSIGFSPRSTDELFVSNLKNTYVEIRLEPSRVEIDEVTVKASPFRRQEESPLSLRRIEISEIEKNPGGNRDISKVIQSFPGVSSTVAFRNDVIVRGGGPSENRFYLDGIEIPNLNHFATQGASGGPVGIINVDFIRGVDFYSGAFPASRGNALSSVLEFRQIDGNPDRLKFKGSVGASDLALTIDGPIGKNTTYIASVRRSYLQLLFSALQLPFLPTYNDFQFKIRSKTGERSELTFIGLGALDQSKLNMAADETPGQRYILEFLPVNEQWNYTFGVVYKRFHEHGNTSWVLSRNYLNNSAYKYRQNDPALGKSYDYASEEADNRFRLEHLTRLPGNIKLTAGGGIDYSTYENRTLSSALVNDSLVAINYNSELSLISYGMFAQASRLFFDERLSLSFGMRMDGNTYNSQMGNPLRTLSPRLSLSYRISPGWYANFNTGRYFQRPPYTMLGYRDAGGNLVNKANGITYIESDQVVGGFEYRSDDKYQVSVEAFYKYQRKYPFSLADSVSLASKGGTFGVYGDEPVYSIGKGRAYGFEVLARLRDIYRVNLIVAYTFVISESLNRGSGLERLSDAIPTAWDNRHILNITATRKFENNWSVGAKWRLVGGAPFTPYDENLSGIKAVWDARGTPVSDFSRFNSLRGNAFHQLDIRVDKQYFFNKWSLNLYLDIQNLYNFKSDEPDYLVRTATFEGRPVADDPYIDANGVERYRMSLVPSDGQGTVLPTVGIIFAF